MDKKNSLPPGFSGVLWRTLGWFVKSYMTLQLRKNPVETICSQALLPRIPIPHIKKKMNKQTNKHPSLRHVVSPISSKYNKVCFPRKNATGLTNEEEKGTGKAKYITQN